MKIIVALGLCLTLLVSCTPAKSYDIDVECWKDEAFVGIVSFSEENTEIMSCYTPKFFEVQCDKSTIQKMEDKILCTTHDKKSVRIVQFSPTVEEVRVYYPNAKK